MRTRLGDALTPLLLATVFGVMPAAAGAQPINLARGRTYTMSPRPNYALTTDAGDDRQLTDGVYTESDPIWVRPSTVGWTNASPVIVVIDLVSVQAISGLSYSTAAGKAGVEWPRSVFALVSDDGRQFFHVADLVAMAGDGSATVPAGYAASRYRASGLETHGRYVAFVVDVNGPYVFCDEIEVFAGDLAYVGAPLTGEPTIDLHDFFVKAHMRVSIQRRLSADLEAARSALSGAPVHRVQRERLSRELDRIAAEIARLPFTDPGTFTAVLPLNDLHARIFAVHGTIASEIGHPDLTAWPVTPWEFVRPLDKPPADAPDRVVIAAMAGETRSGAVNIANSTGQPMTVGLSLIGASADIASDELELSEVVWTDTRELVPVADALVPVAVNDPALTLPAGITRQVWIRFTPRRLAPGHYRANLVLTSEHAPRVRVRLELEVLPGSFPARRTLHLGGWDYTNTIGRGLTADNRQPLIAALRALGVDSPWATAAVMPSGRFDTAGRLIDAPPTSQFDGWITDWPGAAQYCIYVGAPDTFGNVHVADGARFTEAVGQWITFWVTHAARLGIAPSQLVLLLVDEPHSPAQDDRIVAWGEAIKAAQPGVTIWENPTYPDPATAQPRFIDIINVLALKSWLMLREGVPFVDFYRDRLLQHGQALAIYGASPSARLLDPYSYYRLQAWWAAHIGATSSFFWSFSDDGGGRSWNEYATTKPVYSPFFLSRNGVVGSKHVEAIREGAEDFEYLTLLAARIAALGRSEPEHPGLSDAAALLAGASTSVLSAPGATDFQWTADKDRSTAEQVRLAIAAALASLAERVEAL